MSAKRVAARKVAVVPADRLVLEYVRNRRLLRLTYLADEPGTVELPIEILTKAMGGAVTELVPSCQYLVFAGSHERPVGGLADLVGVYRSEACAREAFHGVRAASAGPAEWAEVLGLDAVSNVKRVCWFGVPPRRQSHADPPKVSPRPRRLRLLRK
jgi:hypothetical protein